MTETSWIEFGNQTRISLLQDSAGEFVGLGEVSVSGVLVRNGSRPLRCRIGTQDGILYTRLKVNQVVVEANRAVVRMTAIGLPWGEQAYLDDYTQATLNVEPPIGPIEDQLELVLEACEETIGGETFTGFSYAWHFASKERSIYRVATIGTWEIGGEVTGNTVLHQGQCNMPVYKGAVDTVFTTACLKTLNAYGSPLGNSFQLCPRPGPLQGFDFQYSKEGVLAQYWPEFDSVSSLVESPDGSHLLHVIDEQRFTLTHEVTTEPKRVLFLAGEFAEERCRGLWMAVFEKVMGELRAAYGVDQTIVMPEANHGYGTQIDDDGFKMVIHGKAVPPEQFLYELADEVLPKLAAQGFRRFFPSVVSESDVSMIGMRRKLDQGIHGDLHCSSVCATHRFFPSDYWGGIKAWRYLYDKGKSLGMEIGAWFAPHYSPRAKVWEEHPDWAMIDACSFPAGGGYGFHTLRVGDWNTGLYDYTLNDLRRWKEDGGLDFLFVDSYSNLGLVQQNFAHGMRTNFKQLSRLFADIQGLGIKGFSFESVSAFGHGHFGVADLRDRHLDQNKAVAGQNDFGWWVGNEDMALDVSMMVVPHQRSEEELTEILFRVMANRGYLVFERMADGKHGFPAWYSEHNKIYCQVVEDMHVRRLLPGKAGVEWLGNDRRVVWSYLAQELVLEDAEPVARITADGPVPLAASKTLALEPFVVYRIGE